MLFVHLYFIVLDPWEIFQVQFANLCSVIEYDHFCVAARLFTDGLISPHVYRDLSINRSNYDKAWKIVTKIQRQLDGDSNSVQFLKIFVTFYNNKKAEF